MRSKAPASVWRSSKKLSNCIAERSEWIRNPEEGVHFGSHFPKKRHIECDGFQRFFAEAEKKLGNEEARGVRRK
jgi:hypothetical protein